MPLRPFPKGHVCDVFDVHREGKKGAFISLRCRVCMRPVLWADSHFIQQLDFTYSAKPVQWSSDMNLTREEAEKLR
jgi:hypothetical protein